MQMIDYKDIARNLVTRAIEDYRRKFILGVDILNGEDRKRIVDEIDRIRGEVKQDDREKLLAERDFYKKRVEDLEERLNQICSLGDCDEEFEL